MKKRSPRVSIYSYVTFLFDPKRSHTPSSGRGVFVLQHSHILSPRKPYLYPNAPTHPPQGDAFCPIAFPHTLSKEVLFVPKMFPHTPTGEMPFVKLHSHILPPRRALFVPKSSHTPSQRSPICPQIFPHTPTGERPICSIAFPHTPFWEALSVPKCFHILPMRRDLFVP